MSRTRIYLSEDHLLVREAFKALLAAHSSFEIVGESSSGLATIDAVLKLKPDILLLDLGLTQLHGLEVLRRIKAECDTKIIVLSMHTDQSSIMEALRLGANGYVLKESPSSDLIEAIRCALIGECFLSEAAKKKAFSATLQHLSTPASPAGPGLTRREQLVLRMAAQGKTNQEIARELFISRRTVEAHRANLMKKLSLRGQTDLVLYAVRHKLVTA